MEEGGFFAEWGASVHVVMEINTGMDMDMGLEARRSGAATSNEENLIHGQTPQTLEGRHPICDCSAVLVHA